MIIDVFSICYNEEVMLPFFISHYQKMGANITIYDNQSTDNSVEIAKKAGCNVISYDSNKQIRDDIYLDIKNNCWKKSKAEWSIVCDIDEIIEIPFNIDEYTILNTQGFDISGLPPSRMGVPNSLYSKHVMFRPAEIQEINFTPGCHSCKPIGNVIPSREIANLLHYKYISEDYVISRHKLYQSRLSDINKKFKWGHQYENVAEQGIRDAFTELNREARHIP